MLSVRQGKGGMMKAGGGGRYNDSCAHWFTEPRIVPRGMRLRGNGPKGVTSGCKSGDWRAGTIRPEGRWGARADRHHPVTPPSSSADLSHPLPCRSCCSCFPLSVFVGLNPECCCMPLIAGVCWKRLPPRRWRGPTGHHFCLHWVYVVQSMGFLRQGYSRGGSSSRGDLHVLKFRTRPCTFNGLPLPCIFCYLLLVRRCPICKKIGHHP